MTVVVVDVLEVVEVQQREGHRPVRPSRAVSSLSSAVRLRQVRQRVAQRGSPGRLLAFDGVLQRSLVVGVAEQLPGDERARR